MAFELHAYEKIRQDDLKNSIANLVEKGREAENNSKKCYGRQKRR